MNDFTLEIETELVVNLLGDTSVEVETVTITVMGQGELLVHTVTLYDNVPLADGRGMLLVPRIVSCSSHWEWHH